MPTDTYLTAQTAWTLEVEGGLGEASGALSDPGPPPERYEMRGLIGRGGMGEVWRVRDHVLQRDLVRKVLRPELLEDQRATLRFTNEARITAHLQHPGVVPVYDIGVLEDGRPFYTMQEVRGPRLDEAVTGWPLVRAVEALRRVADVLALAHDHHVVHRDLKPENVMVGRFGAVILLDWGIARAQAPVGQETFPDTIVGTGPYMAPEMASGALDRVGPQSDVWQLGCMLLELLTGAPPRRGSHKRVLHEAATTPLTLPSEGDPGLLALCARMLAWDPSERLRSGREASEALTQWLEGADRRQRALAIVEDAQAHAQRAADLSAQAAALRAQAQRILAPLQPYSPAPQKVPGWRLEDKADAAASQAALEQDLQEQALQAALRVDPGLDRAHRALAALYRGFHEEAERAGRTLEVQRWEQRLRLHDRGEHQQYLAGTGELSVDFEGPIQLSVVEPRDRRLQPRFLQTLQGPVERLKLERGSYLLECGGFPVPVRIDRSGHWSQRVQPPEGLGPEDCWVPEGAFIAGGDPDAADGLPEQSVWVEGFVIRRHPVTVAEYAAFLNAVDAPEQHLPADLPGEPPDHQLRFWREGGRYHAVQPGIAAPWDPALPVTNLRWHDAVAYCAWRAAVDGLPWRLPHSLEWEKAARSVDGRPLPWGRFLEPTWGNTLDASPQRPGRLPVTAHPEDCSPYGVCGLVGNTRDLCWDLYAKTPPPLPKGRLQVSLQAPPASPERWPLVKGGAFSSGGALVRPGTRFGLHPQGRATNIGFRLLRPLPG
ncbi:MAG: bifunctional serine/threonine-protein kinase/formylglycine-generating enzyme family protein [Myxococcota bacterium]|nr:bifunctional serine/threonine-protein kinase/formylglycine-generating enzyme family protein [Myxococcota bacterium]